MTFQPDDNMVEQHRMWLSAFESGHLRSWEKLLGNDPEAAMCEAWVRVVLAENGNEVIPNENLTGDVKAPDFLCQQDGGSFYVEVTCLGIEKVIEVTDLPHLPDGQVWCYRKLNAAIFNACRHKTALRPAQLSLPRGCGDISWRCLRTLC